MLQAAVLANQLYENKGGDGDDGRPSWWFDVGRNDASAERYRKKYEDMMDEYAKYFGVGTLSDEEINRLDRVGLTPKSAIAYMEKYEKDIPKYQDIYGPLTIEGIADMKGVGLNPYMVMDYRDEHADDVATYEGKYGSGSLSPQNIRWLHQNGVAVSDTLSWNAPIDQIVNYQLSGETISRIKGLELTENDLMRFENRQRYGPGQEGHWYRMMAEQMYGQQEADRRYAEGVERFAQRTEEIMGMLDERSNQGELDIEEYYQQLGSAMQQNLISSGLASSNTMPNAMAGVGQQEIEAMNRYRDQWTMQKADTYATLSGQELSHLTRPYELVRGGGELQSAQSYDLGLAQMAQQQSQFDYLNDPMSPMNMTNLGLALAQLAVGGAVGFAGGGAPETAAATPTSATSASAQYQPGANKFDQFLGLGY